MKAGESSSTPATVDEAKQKVLQSLSSIQDSDKLNFLVNRLALRELELVTTQKDVQQLDVHKKRVGLMEKKISALEGMLTKTEMAKSKLEQLCRELNKNNKDLQEKSSLRVQELQKTHEATIEKLKESLSDIKKTVTDKEEKTRGMAEVEQLSQNLTSLSVEYEKRLEDLKHLYEDREESWGSINKSKDDEIVLLKNELKEMHKKVQEVFQENVNLKKELIENDQKMQVALESEIEMRKLLNNYSDKYQNLLHSLARSNESFERVKKEMGRMNGNLIKVEGESRKWRQRLDESNLKLASLTTARNEDKEALALKDRQLASMQELCRRLKNGSGADGGKAESVEAPKENGSSDDASNAKDESPATADA